MEVFKDIKGYEGKYQISNMGRVKSLCSYNVTEERILKQYRHANTPYLFVCLSQGFINENKRTVYKNHDVHRLVAEAFIDNPDQLPFVNHKDENPTNNKASNLEWCTPKYNSNYGSIKVKQCKKVYRYTPSGQFVKCFPSVRSAAEAVGGYAGNITTCCQGKMKTAYGFVWEYNKRKIETNEY